MLIFLIPLARARRRLHFVVDHVGVVFTAVAADEELV